MRIPYYYLTDQLREYREFQVLSPVGGEVLLSRPKFLLPGQTPDPGRLYIVPANQQHTLPASVPVSAALLAAREPQTLMNLIQDIFDRCETLEEALSAAVSTGELRELMDEIESVFDNPVLVHRSNFAIVACSGEVFSNPRMTLFRGTHLPYEFVNILKQDPRYDLFQTSAEPFFFTTSQTNAPALGMNLFPGTEAPHRLITLSLHRPLTESDRFLMELCADHVARALKSTVISGRYADPTGRKERLIELFRSGIENAHADPTVLEQGFSALGWLPTHEYCCVSIQSGTSDFWTQTLDLLCSQLETLLPSACVCTHMGTIAVLLNLTLSGAGVRELLDKCVYFFRDNDLRTGVSNVFSGFQSLRGCHKQSLVVLNFASRPQNFQWVQFFSDVVLDYILEQSNRELPLQLICSPQILQIRQYDKAHQTDFYTTLECYIRNHFNAVQTAKELQIHRSTFLYRMERLQNLFDLDLSQRDSLLYTLLSMKMLEQSKSMMQHE